MELVILYILGVALQGLVFLIYMREMFGLKKNWYFFPILWILFDVIAYLFIQPLKNFVVNIIWCLSLFYIFALIFAKGSLKKRFVLTLLYYLIMMVNEPLWTIVMIKLGLADGMVQDAKLIQIIYIMGQLVTWIVVILLSIVYKKKMYNSSWNKNGTGVLVVAGSSLIIEFINIGNMLKHNDYSWTYIFSIILIIVIDFVCYYFFVVGEDKKRLENEYKVYEEQTNIYEQWIEEQKVTQRTLEAFRHDMKNHISALRGMCNRSEKERTELVEEIDGYLSRIGTNYKVMENKVCSGNALIDAILNMKINYAISKGIVVDKNISIPRELEYNGLDMVIILGNLMDNAIEAAGNIRGDRKLDIELKFDMDNLVIAIENTYNGELDGKNGITGDGILPRTTKENRQLHGIGMKNVTDVVNKYDGVMKWKAESGVFSTEVLLYGVRRSGQ